MANKKSFRGIKYILVALIATLALVVGQGLAITARAAEGLTVLAFTSDPHNTVNNESATRLGEFIDAVEADYGQIEVLGFGGDMSDSHNIAVGAHTGTGNTQPDLYWSNTQSVMDVAEAKVDTVVYTTGNHEYENGNYGSYSGAQATQAAFSMNKIVAQGDSYVVYCMGTESTSQAYSTAQANALKSSLSGITNKTIIVISHYPLHYISGRTTAGASSVIDALNTIATNDTADTSDDNKVIFLWGHNHSQANSSETNYDQIRQPGYSLAYSSNGSKTIQFFYTAAGCMADGDYNSNNGGNAAGKVKGKGIVITINDRNEIALAYYNADGDKLTSNGSSFSDQTTPATGVAIDKTNPNPAVAVGKTLQLTATLQPAGATADITWASSNSNVATVDANGVVTGVAVGTATITASIDTGTRAVVSDSISVEVRESSGGVRTVYVLTNTMQSGNTYVIAGSRTAGASTSALSHNGQSVTTNAVTIHDPSELGSDEVNAVYIEGSELADAALWNMRTVTTSGFGARQVDKLVNGTWYLAYTNGALQCSQTTNYDTNNTSYSSTGTYLQIANRRYLRYQNGTFSTTQTTPNATNTVYVYMPVEICEHDYYCPGMEWYVSESAESATATATFTCLNCGKASEVTATVTRSEIAATCDEPAKWEFTATATGPSGHTITETKTVTQKVLQEVPGTTTTTVYVPVTSITAGKNYVLVNSNQLGNVHAIANGYPNPYSGNSGYGSGYDPKDILVEIQEGSITPTSGASYQTKYIVISNEADAEDAVWSSTSVPDEGIYFSNGGYDLFHNSQYLYLDTQGQDHYKCWEIGDGYVRYERGSTPGAYRYLTYVDGTGWCTRRDDEAFGTVYAFEEVTAAIASQAYVDSEPLGHDWAEPTWEWVEDGSSATATFVCTRDASHEDVIIAQGDAITSTTTGSLITFTATITGPDGETYTDTFETYAAHSHDDIDFTPWTSTTSLPTEPGNYYLTANVTLSERWTVPAGGVSLCLNGHSINVQYSIIDLQADTTLDLYDCAETPGTMTSQNLTVVNVASGATFNMHGGSITGSTFAGVAVYGDFHMFGGSITGNNAGVMNNGRLYVSGNAVIRDNGTSSGGKYNVVMYQSVSPIVVEGPLTEDALIHVYINDSSNLDPVVTCDSPYVITSGLEGNGTIDNFGIDNDYAIRINDDGELEAYIEHTWGEVTYTWAEDNSTCTATRTCSACETVETETVTATSVQTKDPTCVETGETTYTATFTNAAFETQTKTADIEPLGHTYGTPSYEWIEYHNGYSSDYYCKATVECIVCDETTAGHTITEQVDAEWFIETFPSCTQEGRGRYEATFTNELFTKQYLRDIPIPKTSHDLTEHAANEATCEQAGNTEYWTCSKCGGYFSDENGTNAITAEQTVIAATGHAWGEPTYTLFNNNTMVLAKSVCENDSSHVMSEIANVAVSATTDATCTEGGTVTLTAEFENSLFSTQTRTLEDSKAVTTDKSGTLYVLTDTVTPGKNYLIVSQWNVGYVSYSALRRASTESVGGGSVDILSATIDSQPVALIDTSNMTIAVPSVWTAEESDGGLTFKSGSYYLARDGEQLVLNTGEGTVWTVEDNLIYASDGDINYYVNFGSNWSYLATGHINVFLFEEVEATDYTVTTIASSPATNHAWGEPTWKWTAVDGGYTATATFVCGNDSSHTTTETAEVRATAGDGETIYTATVVLDGETYTDTKSVPNEEYNLWVGGVHVNSANKGDILGDGTASYDPETMTLTLNDAHISATQEVWSYTTMIAANLGAGTTLTIKGTAVLDNTSAECGIRMTSGDLVIEGEDTNISVNGYYNGIHNSSGKVTINSGTVESSCGDDYTYGKGISAGTLVINDGTVTANGKTAGFDCGTVQINGGTVTVNASGSGYGGIDADSISISGGKVTVNANSCNAAMFINSNNGSITISGEDTVVNANCSGQSGLVAYKGNVVISGGTLNTQCRYYGISSANDITISGENTVVHVSGGTIRANSGITIESPLGIIIPEGGSAYNAEGYGWQVFRPEGAYYSVDEVLIKAAGIITFVNDDGTELQSSAVAYGETPVYKGETPTKEADAQYTYTFSGWTPEIAEVTGDATYTATYSTTTNKYTITFVNEDGSVLQTGDVEYGETPVYTGTTPTKEATDQYTYTFNGWSPEIVAVTGEATYTATYTETVNEYTITFVNDDGTELQSGKVAYGATPAYEGDTPTKAATDQYTYTFNGWTPEIVAVTGEATYTATYTSTVNKYTITFVDEDGTELQTGEVEYGTVPTYDGETPTKEADAQYSYTFAGWDPVIVEVTGDATYTATYTNVTNKYTVTFINSDGTELQSTEYEYGATPVYEGATPTKAADAQYTYTFAGWSPAITTVTGPATYTATYNTTVNEYTITFVNDDGTVLQSGAVTYGETPVYEGETPTKEATAQYTYTFTGWTPTITSVTGDATYTATYDSTVNEYTITFVNDDGTELQSTKVAYGETPEYTGETPTKAATAQYTYTFDTWTPAITSVTGDATYTATYTSTVNTYTVTWKCGDDELEVDVNVPYGTTPSYDADEPTKAATAQYTYTFSGWEPEIAPVTGDVTYTAQFTETVNQYTITFVNEDGTELQSTKVAYGETPVYEGETPTKAADAQYTYTFAGWSPAITSVTGDATYTATYDSTVNEYTITFVNDDGTELQSGKVAYGETPAYEGETPTKAADAQYTYTFDTWTPAITSVTGDATYTATYSTTVNEYTITFVNEDGSELQSGKVAYGETPVYSGETPTKAADAQYTYTFNGWTPAITSVTGDATYTATYSSTVNEYTISFVNDDGTELQSGKVAYGETPVYSGETPTKAATAQETYTFNGWTPAITSVTGDATYTATYSSTVNKYTITFVDEDGTELQSSEVEYGEVPVYEGETPTKAADDQYTYTFAGWDPAIVEVTGDATYTATYTTETNEYTVTFINSDGTELQSGKVAYGETPVYSGETPTKAADAQYAYTFAGWSPTITPVTGPATYTATYDKTVNEYTITFVNEDGTELQSGKVAYGETPVYSGETPTKAADAQYTYTFDTWTPAITSVTGDATYTATYSTTVNEYTISFVNDDGTELQSGKVAYGETPVYSGETPTKAADAQYTYTFNGWSPAITSVTGDATYTATYSTTVNKYTITFTGEDGSVLQSSEVAYGETPVFSGETPTKDATADYGYTFAGWSPELAPVTGEASYTPVFTQIDRTYGEPTWSWTGNDTDGYTAATATFTTNDDFPTATKTASDESLDVATTPATCTVDGKTVYTASVTFNGTPYTDTKEVTISATGHKWDNGKVTTEPTCTDPGVKTFTCSVCNETRTEAIDPTGHDWNAPTYTWNRDEEGNCISVTAKRTCANDPDHFEEETVDVDSELTQVVDPTDETEGSITYTSKPFKNEAFTVQNLTDTIPANGHEMDYENLVWDWTGNDTDGYTAATATANCKNDDGYSVTSPATVTSQTTNPTCTATGKTVYTAKVTFEGNTYTDEKTVTIPANGHKEGEVTYENYKAPTCTEPGSYDEVVYCTVCGDELSRETKTINPAGHKEGEVKYENYKAPTCTEPGSYDEVVYCTVCGDELSRETKAIDPAGHDWGKPGYTWADDYSSVTAIRTCLTDSSHVEKETVPTTSVKNADGSTTYTATFENEAFEDQTKTVAADGVLTFNLNGGTLNGVTGSFTIEAKVGDTITIPAAPTRDGYTFLYWEGSEYYPGDEYEVTGDHTFTAKWEENAQPTPGGDSPAPGGNGQQGGGQQSGGQQGGGPRGNGTPATGDITNLVPAVVAAAGGIAALVGAVLIRRRDDDKR